MLQITQLDLHYQDFQALKDINIQIEDGEIFGIIGMSGAGKTSLIRCICGLETPNKGAVVIDDLNIAQLNNKQRRLLSSRLGVVFQGCNLLMQKNVFDNIALPLKINKVSKNQIENRVKELLQLVDLSDKAYTYPSKLSGGQKQRVAIARALAANPNVLLLDEITSALDPLNTKSVLTLLKKINEETKVTIILITHEINVVKMLCQRMCVIDSGEVVEIGKVDEMFRVQHHEISKLLLGNEVA